jgi:hypothetical protein
MALRSSAEIKNFDPEELFFNAEIFGVFVSESF